MHDICRDVAKRLNADAMYEVMCLAVRRGRANAHVETRSRYMEKQRLAPGLPKSLHTPRAPAPGIVPRCVKIFNSPKKVVQMLRDPNCSDRVAVATADGYIIVVRCTTLDW